MTNVELVIIILMVILLFSHLLLPSVIRSKFIRLIVPGLSLLILWVVLVVYQSFLIEKVFTVLTDSYSSKTLIDIPDGEILAGSKIIGNFTASEDYLGILGVKFWTFYRLNSDFLIFRIREKGQDDWLYENFYKSDQFQPNAFFTFGFPVIIDSKGKTYDFEIISSAGVKGNAVGLSSEDPVYIVKYKYPRDLITNNPKDVINFFIKKLINLSKNSVFTASSFIYLIPFLLYVVFVSRIKRESVIKLGEQLAKGYLGRLIINKKAISLGLCLVGVFVDTFFIKDIQISLMILISLFIYSFYIYKINSNYYFLFSVMFLLVSAVFLNTDLGLVSERAGAWSWIFMVIWLFIRIWKLRKSTFSRSDF